MTLQMTYVVWAHRQSSEAAIEVTSLPESISQFVAFISHLVKRPLDGALAKQRFDIWREVREQFNTNHLKNMRPAAVRLGGLIWKCARATKALHRLM